MKLKDAIREANAADDEERLARLVKRLMIRHQATYLETREFFQKCDPSIDEERFEEIAGYADAY